MASCCECGDEPSGSCATELVNPLTANDDQLTNIQTEYLKPQIPEQNYNAYNNTHIHK